jgi:DNA-binding transcriptional regulator YiaG
MPQDDFEWGVSDREWKQLATPTTTKETLVVERTAAVQPEVTDPDLWLLEEAARREADHYVKTAIAANRAKRSQAEFHDAIAVGEKLEEFLYGFIVSRSLAEPFSQEHHALTASEDYRKQLLEITNVIVGYWRAVLSGWSREIAPQQWAQAQFALANAYEKLVFRVDRPEVAADAMEKAFAALEEACAEFPEEYQIYRGIFIRSAELANTVIGQLAAKRDTVANVGKQAMKKLDLSAKELRAIANAHFDPTSIRQLMDGLGFDQGDLAEAVGTGQSNVSKWLRGQPPGGEYLKRMKTLAGLRGLTFDPL